MTKKQKKSLQQILIALALVILLKLLLRVLPALPTPVELLLYLIPYFVVGKDVLRKAIKGVKNRQPFDECFLMAVATVGAFALGDYVEGCAVILFYQIGELFQSVAVGKSRQSISSLMDIRPDYANVEDEDGKLEQVDPDDVEVGTVIVVQPGERVPIDGVIVEGTSALNTAALTGESLPRDVQTGDEVISGCVNMTGLLKVRTTKEFGESTVSKILDLVENSSMKKARAENFITRFARVYTPAVCYGALALAFLPPIVLLLMGQPARFGDWIYRALTFLVISCPCALVISIPLSFFGGIGGASACGILVKGSTYLEELARTGIVVFDKTGTLTQGTFKVTGVHPADGITDEQLVEAAALAESWSKHPISLSIKAAYGKEIDSARVTDVEELGGHGVTAKVDGKPVAAGNARLMERLGLSAPAVSETGTVVHVAIDGRYAGCLLIADVVKPHSAEAIRALKAAGVRKTVMLTGDAEPVAKAVSAQLGLDEYHAGLLPGDKVDQIETLIAAKKSKENLAFVGDGINDAPVLSRADVGIAMGALGSDAAIEAADVVLMDDDPAKIALAMRIARRTLRIVYENIVFALAVKFACLLLGAIGMASMWTAIFADVGVMVIAVLNATRALYTKDLVRKSHP
ncbi:MAG: cadmium-translocating P-type ATPase [Faecalibacterium sp.]|nr:cadmium-translocating P-type ATPase [Faecalibacterium sp.]